MDNLKQKASSMNNGDVMYVTGDVKEIRQELESVGEFFVAPVGNGECKITKPGRAPIGVFGWLCGELNNYNGKPISFRGNISNIRNYVSRYNSIKGTSFRVRGTTYNAAEIYTDEVTDCKSITRVVFDIEMEKINARIVALRSRLVDELEEHEQEHEQEQDQEEWSSFDIIEETLEYLEQEFINDDEEDIV